MSIEINEKKNSGLSTDIYIDFFMLSIWQKFMVPSGD